MTILSDYVSRMVDGGMDMDEAMQIAAELFAAGVASAAVRPSAGALRMRKLRHKASQSVTGDAAEIGSAGVTKRHETSQSVTSDKTPLSTISNIKKRERPNRGTRVDPNWAPTDAERTFGKQQGFSEFEVNREADKFRDYWTACAGSKGVKLDWSATWRQWVRNGAERAGKTPAPQPGDKPVTGFYAAEGSEQLDAWDAYNIHMRGKPLPRDRKSGWHVTGEWPPGHVPKPQQSRDPPPAPILRAM